MTLTKNKGAKMKETQEQPPKVSLTDLSDYINFQFDGLAATLKRCGVKQTLACIDLARSLFGEETKDLFQRDKNVR